ncbi:Plasma membrane sulfite pump involved in sulfite metabolism [Coemansia sp. RSA 2706]|nr:Plasma membrane sulfite pump involved in sulfite metabolism [Coemansia sp. RSA 2706]KAJ2312484.1 Plasma membrane sulfite pump involved in sulfite metabolism [Coemansia sp. RSA 2705]
MHSRLTTDHSEVTFCVDSVTTHQTRLDVIKSNIQRPMNKLDTRRDAIRGFSPAWFTASMATGMTSMLLYGFPYKWKPLEYIGIGIALLNLVMFVFFMILFLWRLIQYRDFGSLILHPQQSMALGAVPMALTTIITSLVTILTPYNPSWMPMLALVLWSIAITFSVLSFMVIPFLATSHQRHDFSKVNATLLLPIVPTVVAASAGAVLASVHTGTTAVAIILISYALLAMGVGLSMLFIASYIIRLVLFKLPPPEIIFTVFIPIGPMGQSSYAIQLLGVQALRVLPDSLPQLQYLGHVLHDIGFLFGLLMWAFAFWWVAHAIYSVVYTRIHGPVPFNLGWWAIIFPTGTFAASCAQLGVLTGFTFFRVLASLVTSCIVVIWIVVIFGTLCYAWTGELLKPANINILELNTEVPDDR